MNYYVRFVDHGMHEFCFSNLHIHLAHANFAYFKSIDLDSRNAPTFLWFISEYLQFMDWIERRKLLNFEDRDYACHLDLIARNQGFEAAQKYIERVPTPFRNEVLYETLLVNCVCQDDVRNAQQVFNEIRELSLPLTVSACNQMILLYKRIARS